jgi:hypothetical protein
MCQASRAHSPRTIVKFKTKKNYSLRKKVYWLCQVRRAQWGRQRASLLQSLRWAFGFNPIAYMEKLGRVSRLKWFQRLSAPRVAAQLALNN